METIVKTTTEELPNPSDEPDSGSGRKRRNATQSQQHAQAIGQAVTFCHLLENDSEIATLLQRWGIDATELSLAKSLTQRGQATFVQRQNQMGLEDAAVAETARLLALVKTQYRDFRNVARARCTAPGSAATLGLDNRPALDRHTFLMQIRASYMSAMQPPFQDLLGRSGYRVETLQQMLSEVSALEMALSQSQAAQGAAARATQERNQAVDELNTWLRSTRALARTALRERPDLLRKLDL